MTDSWASSPSAQRTAKARGSDDRPYEAAFVEHLILEEGWTVASTTEELAGGE